MKSFNKRLATQLAYFSQLAYTPKSNINYELTEFGIIHLEDKETDTQGFIAIDDKNLFIVFRGTTNLKDWRTNLNTNFGGWEVAENTLTAHEGFLKAYNSVKDKIHNVIIDNPSKEVHITGHSLAGSLANLCAVELFLNKDVRLGGLYTFGSPRVFDSASAAHLNSILKGIHFRFVNNNDIVPHLPPEASDFSHWGRLMYFRESGALQEDEELSWWERIQYAAEGILGDIGEIGVDSVKDHDGAYYQKLLEKTLTSTK